MDERPSVLKRLIITSLVCVTIVGGSGLAKAGPEDEVRALLLAADNMFAAGISPVDVFLAWKQRTPLPDSVRYRIEMATDELGPYIEIGESGCANVAGSCVAVVQPQTTPSDPTPRFYRVVPILAPGLPNQLGGGNVHLLEGPPSDPDPAILGPARPTNLRCNGNFACLQVQSITLTWTDNSDESLFWIMRAKGAINPTFGTEPHATVPADTTTYSETIQEFNTTYFYKVVAVREENIPRADGSVTVERAFSDSTTGSAGGGGGGGGGGGVKIETPPIPPPSDPFGLTASFTPPSLVTLTWTDTAIDEDGFYIEFGSTATDWETQTTANPREGVGAKTWTQIVPPDTKRCYRVRAYKLGPAYSGYTNTVCLGSIPTAPIGLTATAISNTQVNLHWTDRSDAEDTYVIERCPGFCTASGSWTQIGEEPADTTTFSDMNTLSSTNYSYRVFASNASGRSASSNIAWETTLAAPLPRPTNLVASGMDVNHPAIGSHRIRLTWTDNSGSETGFRIEYLNGDGEWETLTNVGPKAGSGLLVTYIDTWSLPANFERCYRVRAVKGTADVSDPSNKACGRTGPPLPPNGAPTDLAATGVFDRRIDLEWRDNSTNEDAFRIEVIRFPNQHCTGQSISGLPWNSLGTVQPLQNNGDPFDPDQVGMRHWTLTGLQPHTAHFFRVIAVNQDGVSTPAAMGCTRTLGPPIPTFVDPNDNGDFEVTRCSVKLTTPIMENGEVETNRMRLRIVPTVPGGPALDVITIWLHRDNKRDDGQPGPHDDIPGAVYPDTTVGSPTYGMDIWEFEYQFRKGINYGLLASSEGPQPTTYMGDEARLRDITVAADCPQSGL